MKKFLLFAFLVFLVTGCAEDTTNNNSTTEGQTSQEQLNKVDDAFTNEYKKYVKQDDLSTAYAGEFSAQSETNIKSLLQNITGRGKMPPQAGIGEINETVVASALAKSMAESLVKATTEPDAQALVKYTTLDTDANTFMSAVLGGFMGGATGAKILETGKLYQANQKAIAMLVASHTALFQAANETVTEEGTTNLAHLYSSLTGYFTMLQITALPTDEATVNKIAQAVYNHCKTSSSSNAANYNTINTYNANTTTFKVMPILTCGTSNPMGDDMKAFMNGVGQAIDPNYQFSMGGRP